MKLYAIPAGAPGEVEKFVYSILASASAYAIVPAKMISDTEVMPPDPGYKKPVALPSYVVPALVLICAL
jgi:hypothetical protein